MRRIDRFNSSEEPKWFSYAFKAGVKARKEGKALSDNPEIEEWCRKSWAAGWADEDMKQNVS